MPFVRRSAASHLYSWQSPLTFRALSLPNISSVCPVLIAARLAAEDVYVLAEVGSPPIGLSDNNLMLPILVTDLSGGRCLHVYSR